jgi:hypothetical protein
MWKESTMRVPESFAKWVLSLIWHHTSRIPDEIVGHQSRWRASRPGDPVRRPFLLRWYILPKNPFGCNMYLHQFIRDDEDRALHDHPWFNMSLLLSGQYIEHTIRAGGIHWRQLFKAGAVKFRSPWSAHRVELTSGVPHGHGFCVSPDCDCDFQPGSCRGSGRVVRAPNLPEWVEYDSSRAPSWSLFVTGPKMHLWGFHCPKEGWQSSRAFHDHGGCE